MYISSLFLENYRNYELLEIDFSKELNIIIGNNAEGKTNLVESIYLMGFGKSFRTSNDKDLIKLSKSFFHISGKIIKDQNESEIDIKFNNKKKIIQINEVPLIKLSELIGFFNVVVFSPEDLYLIKGSPSHRRKYLDKSISQIYPNYYKLLIEYNKILKQRNILLKQKNRELLFIFNQQLADVGTKIIKYRTEYIKELKEVSKKIHFNLSEGENLKIEYLSNNLNKDFKDDEFYDKIYNGIIKDLEKKIELDMKRGTTSVGPHRDDISIKINEKEAKIFGSQGQIRTISLTLKLSEIEMIKKLTKEQPILILDDVMSELDHKRQNKLIDSIKGIQTFITTTSDDFINTNDYKKIYIENGEAR